MKGKREPREILESMNESQAEGEPSPEENLLHEKVERFTDSLIDFRRGSGESRRARLAEFGKISNSDPSCRTEFRPLDARKVVRTEHSFAMDCSEQLRSEVVHGSLRDGLRRSLFRG